VGNPSAGHTSPRVSSPEIANPNGQYLGLFEMGAHERRIYGHASNAWAQDRSAYRYFNATGRDWSPWQCKP
jgi:hypothetical protein